jgi:phosphoenolpyruvate-protein phosphotransferase (PTS system enzyme I)
MTGRSKTKAIRLNGTPVSQGLARGPLILLEEGALSRTRQRGSAREEIGILQRALDDARTELTALMARTRDADAEALLAFQVAMLEDEEVRAPAFKAIDGGAGAEEAWRQSMELQIKEYHEAEDLYFRARAADIRDIRDRVLRRLAGTAAAAIPPGSVVVTTDLPPSRFLEIAWDGGGAALFEGSPNSHVAMLARARGVPMIVGMERAVLTGHSEAILDADDGMLVVSPDCEATVDFTTRQQLSKAAREEEERYLAFPATTASGERVQVLVNVADGSELGQVNPDHCDGIGLVRTEFLLRTADDLADEEKQYDAYRRIVEWARGKPVTIRTLDAGGDKPIPGYTVDAEANPFLGVRGVRLSLLHPKVLTTQLRALARAAALGRLKVMVPMVTGPRELDQVRAILEATVSQLRQARISCAMPALGMMVEVPAVAVAMDLFDAEFYSIGSNDLIQYTTACSRDSGQLSALQDPLQPAVLRLIHMVVEHANKHGIDVSLCGDMASDGRCVPALLDMGLRCLSVAPAALGRVKGAIARHKTAAMEDVARETRSGT